MKRISLVLFFLLVCLPSVFGGASDPPASLETPCCTIISIDRVTGIVTEAMNTARSPSIFWNYPDHRSSVVQLSWRESENFSVNQYRVFWTHTAS